MGSEERAWLLRRVGQARATALTMVYQDGSTQFDPEQVSGSGSWWRLGSAVAAPAAATVVWVQCNGILGCDCITGSRLLCFF